MLKLSDSFLQTEKPQQNPRPSRAKEGFVFICVFGRSVGFLLFVRIGIRFR